MFVLVIAFAAAAQVATAPPATQEDDPIICTKTNVGDEVGTHMRSKKVCMKKSDREFIEKQAQRTLGNINNNGNGRQQFVPTPR